MHAYPHIQVIYFPTLACCVPDAPTGVTPESLSPTSVRVTWGLPSGFTCISHILITVTPEGESAVEHDVGQVTEYTIDSLTCNTTYMFGVIAVADSNGTRVPSEEGAVTLTQCPTVEVSPTTTVKEGTISSTHTLDVKGEEITSNVASLTMIGQISINTNPIEELALIQS